MPGARRLKGYPVTADELWELGGIGLGTSLCFSFGTSFLTQYFGIKKDLEFSQGLPPEVVIRWKTVQGYDLALSIVLFLIGVLVFLFGGAKIYRILRSTEHR
jgi:hypothetical protein